jgi:hypothetical protein
MYTLIHTLLHSSTLLLLHSISGYGEDIHTLIPTLLHSSTQRPSSTQYQATEKTFIHSYPPSSTPALLHSCTPYQATEEKYLLIPLVRPTDHTSRGTGSSAIAWVSRCCRR